MHRRTFLQSLCVLAAAATIGHVPVRAPAMGEWTVHITHGACYVQGRHDDLTEAWLMAQRMYNRIQSDIMELVRIRPEYL